jgi:hypothetical protein
MEPARIGSTHLKVPWYGYELGYWSDRNGEETELALQGKHFEIGERAKKERKKLDRASATDQLSIEFR